MYGLVVLRKLTANWMSRMMTYAFPVALFVQWLMRSLKGTLILLGIVWLYRWHFSEVKPWTSDQLAIWVGELDSDVKGAILTALLTVIGFTVAFQTAAEAWKMQALGQLRLRLADEIEKFFGDASVHIIDLGVYSKSVIKAHEAVLRDGFTDNTAFTIEYVLAGASTFVTTREKLSRMGIDVHGLGGRNLTLLSGIPGAPEYLEDIVSALDKITDVMWRPVLPVIEGDRGYKMSVFVKLVDVNAFVDLVETCDRFRPVINGIAGGLTGALRGGVIRPNFSTFLYMLKRRKIFVEAFSKLDEVKRR